MKVIVRYKWIIGIFIILIAGFIFFRQRSTTSNKKKESSTIVKRQNIKETLSLSGHVDAEESVTLRFQTSGRLSWVGVKEGDYVKKYQTIASLDQRDIKKSLEKKLISFSKTRWDFDQTKDDNKDVLTDKIKRVLDKAQFDLNSSVLDVELQQLAIEYSYLSTPIEGIVTKVGSPYAGINITPAQAEFEIINPKTIYFSITADQTEVIKLQKGQIGEIALDAYLEKKLHGIITSIGFIPKAGETGTVYELKLALNDQNGNVDYRIGMTGDISFTIKEKENVLAIPTSYIKTEKGKKYVTKNSDKKKVKQFITLGDTIDALTEVISGLEEGDIIYD